MNLGFRISAVHLDAVLLIRSVALLHPATVRGVKAPITIRNGAADDDGVRHAERLSRPLNTTTTDTAHRNRRDLFRYWSTGMRRNPESTLGVPIIVSRWPNIQNFSSVAANP
jgi:hypothetical protein